MKQRLILITGGAGNIGGSLSRKLVEDPANFVVVVDNLSTGSRSKLPDTSRSNFKFIESNVNDADVLAAVMQSYSFDFVFHYAAVVGVDRTLNNPIEVLNDIDGIRNILELSRKSGVKRIFYSSSSEVYGEPVGFPQFEDTTPLNSRLPYAIVKNVGEAFCRSYYQSYGLKYTIFRFFNTYGPGQSEDFVLPRFLKAAISQEDIRIYGDGSQTRTFCYVDDNVDTTMSLLNNSTGENETINVGSDVEISILELAKKVIAFTDSSSKIIHLAPLKEGDMTRRQPDISRMKSHLKRPLISLDNGIRKLMEAYMIPKSV